MKRSLRRGLFWTAAAMVSMTSNPSPAVERDAYSKTLKDLRQALQGETTASYKYSLYAKRAEVDGYPEVAKMFRAISKSEAVHRENHKGAIRDLGGQVPDLKPQDVTVRSTRQNLEEPIEAEKSEKELSYPQFIRDAKSEGAQVAAKSFTYARDAEAQHEKLFEKALETLGKNPPSVQYFVHRKTGETLAVAEGRELKQDHAADYLPVA
jgi:rubrerythrin